MSLLKIIVNGEPQTTSAKTLEDLCKTLGYGDSRIATALNGTFVPAMQRVDTHLAPDDRIEIVAPRQGG